MDVVNNLCRYRSFAVFASQSGFSLGENPCLLPTEFEDAGYVVASYCDPRMETLTFSLSDRAQGRTIWAVDYAAAPENLERNFRLLSSQIASELATGIEKNQRTRAENFYSTDTYASFLDGLTNLETSGLVAIRRARASFQRALKVHAEWAELHARIAQTRILEWLVLGGTDPKLLADARRFAESAIGQDPGDATGHWMLGVVALYQRDAGLSQDSFERAEALAPHSADLLVQHADALSHWGDVSAAQKKFQKAISLNPIAPDRYWWAGAGIAFDGGCFSEAIQLCKRMKDVEPAIRVLTASQALAGDIKQAKKSAKKLIDIYPGLSASEIVALSPDSRPEVKAKFVEGLRLAGVS